MKHPISAPYGLTLAQAAEHAIAERDHLTVVLEGLWPSFEFDFHGLRVPMAKETSAEDLIAEVTDAYETRAALYEATPPAADAYEREQGGKIDEPLEQCVVSAVQCGGRWANLAYQQSTDSLGRLRHVFEFNGIRVAFNPWRAGEDQRVLAAVIAQLPEGARRRVSLPDMAAWH